jgi:hypothetical protein
MKFGDDEAILRADGLRRSTYTLSCKRFVTRIYLWTWISLSLIETGARDQDANLLHPLRLLSGQGRGVEHETIFIIKVLVKRIIISSIGSEKLG